MSALMQRIRQDHVYIARLMDILGAQVELFRSGEAPDYNLMLDIMHYMLTYPNIAHHDVEEWIFQKLLVADPEWQKQAQKITAQHQELAKTAQEFTHDLEAIVDGESIMPRDQIEQSARYYIELLLNHLGEEEADLLPAAEKTLTDEDFKEIEGKIPNIDDPMRNKQLLKQYETLYSYITSSDVTLSKTP